GVARERRTVAFDIQTRSERNDARVDGDDTEAGRQTDRGRAGASVAVRIVGRGQHVERGVGETHGAVRCVFGKTRVSAVGDDAADHDLGLSGTNDVRGDYFGVDTAIVVVA